MNLKNKKIKICVGVLCYKEGNKFLKLLNKLNRIRISQSFKIVIVDDYSHDITTEIVKKFVKDKQKFKLIVHKKNFGVGKSIKDMISFSKQNKFDVITIMAGNGKDNPNQLNRIINPIINENYDYIQGSRFLKSGSYKNLPKFRMFLIKGFTLMMSIFVLRKLTDAANGFRAYKLSLFNDKRINLNQNWLNQYEFETYLHYKILSLRYKFKEVPVSKDYIKNFKKYSHIRPLLDWWKIMRPIFLLKLGIKR